MLRRTPRHAGDDIRHNLAGVAGCCDIEKHKFVGALGVVTFGKFDGVSRIPQSHKVYTFDDTAAGDVEAGDDSFSEH